MQCLQDMLRQGKQHTLRKESPTSFLSPWFSEHVTSHQWAVYDFTTKHFLAVVSRHTRTSAPLSSKDHRDQVPLSLLPSPVGSALGNNPFAMFVPCYCIIASLADSSVSGARAQRQEEDKGTLLCSATERWILA